MGNRNVIMENIIKDIDSAYAYLKTSAMFKLSLSSKELFHSNFLEWLSNVDQEAFKGLILDMAGIEEDYEWPNVWRGKREYNNFDLCVVAYNQDQYKNKEDERIDDDDDFRILFVIENKVKSIPYKEQLERYTREAEAKNNAYWNNRGSALLKRNGINGNKDDGKYWIGVDEGFWVLKKSIKSGRGKDAKWSEVKKLIPATDDGKWKNNKTNFIEYYAEQGKNQNPPIHYILLSLAKNFPEYDGKNVWKVDITDSKDNEIEIDWKVCYYSNYYSKIANAFKLDDDGLNSQIIKDYCKFIESLTTLSEEWAKDYEEDSQGINKFLYLDNTNYKRAHQFRIHDLYQKLKFSYLCTQLFGRVKDKFKDCKVYPSNQAGLFKEKNEDFGKTNMYICVNYTYLHGDPLLEINVHPKCENGVELYYAIQVQGSAYEHGIQVKKNNDLIEKSYPSKLIRERVLFSEIVWNHLIDETISIIPNWMNIYEVSKWEKAEWMDVPNKENKCYNKYDMNDGTYVYQKYIINNDVTIKTVLSKMINDLQYICDNIKQCDSI